MNSKPQLHVSMLNMLSKCGVQFQRRYGARFGVWDKEEIIAPSIALITGGSVHVAAEQNLRHKIENGELLTGEAVADLARDAFEGDWAGGVLLTDEESINIEKTRGEAIDQTVKLSVLHHQEFAPITPALEVEKRFVIALNGFPIDLSGTMDIVEESAIGDIKTMSANKSSVQSTQMAMYATAFKIEKGKYPARLYHQKLIKTKTPKAIIEEIEPETRWINPLHRRIERFVEIIDAVKSGKQAFTPADPNDWICTRKFCGYAESCKFWSGR